MCIWELKAMNNQWFYLRQWKQSAWQRLLEYRTIKVIWKLEDTEARDDLPKIIKIPLEVELTDDGISTYILNTYGVKIIDWNASRSPLEIK